MPGTHELESLLALVRAHSSTFYRDRWGSAESFNTLPTVSRADFINSTLPERRYKDARSLVKLVHTPAGSFLSEWAFEDIACEHYGQVGRRPMVYMSDPHETIEKSMWCYERGVVPLAAEKGPELAAFTAHAYAVDSLLTDATAVFKLLPHIASLMPLSSITIFGDSFDVPELLALQPLARSVTLLWRYPETGALAEAPLSLTPVFSAVPGVILEEQESVVATKVGVLVTPIIRYQSTLPAGRLTFV